MTITSFLSLIPLIGIIYMIVKNIRLWKAIHQRHAKHDLSRSHQAEHITFSIAIFGTGILMLIPILTCTTTQVSDLVTLTVLNKLIQTLPFIILGWVAEHLTREEGGDLNYHV